MNGNLRATSVALLFAALAFAIGLSASPQLHHWLHQTGDWSQHECAATLLSSGSVEHFDGAPTFAAPRGAPSVPACEMPLVAPVLPSLEFTRLEHAPPALS